MGYPSIPFTVTLTDDFNLFLISFRMKIDKRL